ncbi:MAG: threonine--tRNA ligase [Bdellovibrio sp. CG12_big_fil_rev_8_21_14_0_65_39_13]|nr:MAG: threonine--tRNA ligase [Bdellovibrio sp. CG22_combo_CG10-13_8_21_14_all_39_27]PIQ57606.1 MAG: threonine--tRNA ligase [Bdellovibrio sp. CG12_big_fil_rev_8_21_14_0_65_39_13]PIR35770.1 MAG: threonine--tRNA ligase [Bdellovibrio sp. CG11_big_fil_rev_8_21_14_0_20_39_38]
MAHQDLETIRHSSAHLMAQAIERLWPESHVQFGVGPTIENGFYYDVEMDYRLTEEDLKKIETKMKEIIKEKLPVERVVMKRNEAIEFFKKKGQALKVELISAIPENEEISCYQQGEFIDLCRGPHVENTSELTFYFKILHTAGAYWRGDSNRQMLQRVYAACFLNKEDLKEHLHFLEEAKKRDHRKLGKELELFHFEGVAPASPFFMPKGAFVYNSMIEFMRRIYKKFDYSEVITPQILDSDLWHTSGHYEHYKDNMYFSNIDEKEYAVKPMNCPCHMLMFKHYRYSYRDLPLRYADFGRLHRYEKAGAVAGLTRVRTFCQDDAHIFLPMDKIQAEIKDLMNMFFICYAHFGFNKVKVNLSTRPEKKSGDDATWDKAESALKGALDQSGHEYHIKEGDGAFYGPKIDIEIADALNRYHQLGTIQLDFQLPERFDLTYTTAEGSEERPVVIHRALLGSLERFFGVYLEHVGGAFPFWLAPNQATIVPVNNDLHLAFAQKIKARFDKLGLRIHIDDRNESMGYKTRQIQKGKIPFMLVIGDREMETNTLSVRGYGQANSETLSVDDVEKKFLELDLEKMPAPLRD